MATPTKPRRIIVRTAEQRERKRIQDREAQRVARERNKALLDDLEQQLRNTRECHDETVRRLTQEKTAAIASARAATRRAEVAERKLHLLQRRLIATVSFLHRPNIDLEHDQSAIPNSQSPEAWSAVSLSPGVTSSPPRITSLLPYNIPTKTTTAMCPLDQILLTFVSSRSRMLQEGEIEAKVIGPPSPSMAALLGFCPSATMPDICRVLTDVVTTMEAVNQLPEQVAVLWLMYAFLRWQINPSVENCQRLPQWILPLPSQHSTSHPIWMDYVPWPQLRARIVQNYHDYPQDDFFLPYTQSLSLNWPYEPMDTVAMQDYDSDIKVDPKFEAHARNIDNWTLGPSFAAAYPSLAGTYNMRTVETAQGG